MTSLNYGGKKARIWLTDKSCTPSPPTPLPEGEGSQSTPPVPSPIGRGIGRGLSGFWLRSFVSQSGQGVKREPMGIPRTWGESPQTPNQFLS
ncbi:MAG: hypothetical protein LVT47_02020 [Cyanobacteria bacterium LVE1205-1]